MAHMLVVTRGLDLKNHILGVLEARLGPSTLSPVFFVFPHPRSGVVRF